MEVCPECNRPLGCSDHHDCQVGCHRQGQEPAALNNRVGPRFEAAPVPTLEQIEARCREIRRRWSEEVMTSRLGARNGSCGLGWQPPIVHTSEIGWFEDAPWA